MSADPQIGTSFTQAPASAPRKRKMAPTKRGAPDPAPLLVATASHTESRFFNVRTVRRVVAGAIFTISLAAWVWVDGPQGYWGTEEWVASLARLAGHPYRPPWYVTTVLYVFATAITNFLWIGLAAWWDWFKEKMWRFALITVPLMALVLAPLTALDVMKSAAGFYGFFAPLDLTSPQWWLVWGSLGESTAGSVLSQIVVMWMLRRWGAARKGGQEG